MNNIGCKILGDLCQPGTNDLCSEVCITKDEEDTDKKCISKACYPQFLQKLNSHPWKTFLYEVYLCFHEGKKRKKKHFD